MVRGGAEQEWRDEHGSRPPGDLDFGAGEYDHGEDGVEVGIAGGKWLDETPTHDNEDHRSLLSRVWERTGGA